jgi:hypothetical protein
MVVGSEFEWVTSVIVGFVIVSMQLVLTDHLASGCCR